MSVSTLRPKQNGRNFPDDIFKCIFLNENVWISIEISLKNVTYGPVNINITALVQIMAYPTRRQAIIWIDDSLFYWRIYAPLGLNELTYDLRKWHVWNYIN